MKHTIASLQAANDELSQALSLKTAAATSSQGQLTSTITARLRGLIITLVQRQAGVMAAIAAAAATGPHASPSQLLIAPSWLDDTVPIPADYMQSNSTKQSLSHSQQRRLQGQDIVVDWSGLPLDCVAVRLRVLGPTIEAGTHTATTRPCNQVANTVNDVCVTGSTTREDQVGCVRPLSHLRSSSNTSVDFNCVVVYATRLLESGHQVEWEGPQVVLKGLVTPRPVASLEHSSMQSAADCEVLSQLPVHANIVEVVHHFAAPALLLRPFVDADRLPHLALAKTRCVVWSV